MPDSDSRGLRPESVNLEAWDESDTPVMRDRRPKGPRRVPHKRHPDAYHILPLRVPVDGATHGLWLGDRLICYGTEELVRDQLARVLALMKEEEDEA